jgi:ABC-2 type transport system ATP-binding protein
VVEKNQGELVVKFAQEHRGNELLKLFVEQGVEVTSFNEELPSINEIFIRQVGSN